MTKILAMDNVLVLVESTRLLWVFNCCFVDINMLIIIPGQQASFWAPHSF